MIVPDGDRYPVIVAGGPEDVLQQHRVAVAKRLHVRSVLLGIEQILADFLHDILGLGELDQITSPRQVPVPQGGQHGERNAPRAGLIHVIVVAGLVGVFSLVSLEHPDADECV